MTNLVAPDEHQLLVFWSQLVILLFTARLLGYLFRRVGQPAVVGELAAGLLLGPSVLGNVAPDAFRWLFPADAVQSGMLLTIGWIGVVLLLIGTGFETDLSLIRRLGKGAAMVAAGSLLVPIVFGAGVGFALPGEFLGDEADRTVFALFMATALSISSLPVIAKILIEMGLMRRNFGQMTLAAGMANDVVGWLLLGIIAGLAQAGEIAVGPILVTILGMAAFLAAMFTVGQRLVDLALRELRRQSAGPTGVMTTVVVFALGAGAITQWLGVEAVLGAFVAGILLGRSRFRQTEVEEHLEVVTTSVFAPIFFATAGLRVDLGLLGDPTIIFWGVVVIVVASVSKFVGSVAGAQLASLSRREGIALGAGLNARGALEIIIATVGLSLGALNDASYTIIVLMAMATSIMAGPILRAVVRNWRGDAEEQERLQREEALARNIVVKTQRLLLPSQGGPNSIVAAQVLHLAWPEQVEVTVLSVGEAPDEAGVQAVVDVFADRPVVLERVGARDASAAILREAQLGYGAIGVGAPDSALGPWILSPIVDELLTATQVPLIIVRRARNLDRLLPSAFARAIVPVSASAASRTAQEIAFNLSARLGTELVLTHVVRAGEEQPRSRSLFGWRPGHGTVDVHAAGPHSDVALRVLDQAESHADELGARHRPLIRAGATADEIVAVTREERADLLVLGANLRRFEGRPFLGHMVEQVLDDCDCTIVVVATPSGPHG